jgi:hypothetical protein
VTRAEERDAIDVAAALEIYTTGQLIALARQLEPGLEDEDFTDAGRRLDRLSDRVFRRYGLGPEDITRLRERFASWPRSLSGVRPSKPERGNGLLALQEHWADRELDAGR